MAGEMQNGEAAFPVFAPADDEGAELLNKGMALRDYFAAHALAGMLGNENFMDLKTTAARNAYEYADAMLEARKEGP